MASLGGILGPLFKGLGKVDEVKAVVEVANAGRKFLSGQPLTAPEEASPMKTSLKEARLEAAIAELTGPEISGTRESVLTYLRANRGGTDRIQAFLNRMHESTDEEKRKLENRWEVASAEMCRAMQDGFGAAQRRAAPPAQPAGRRQRQQPPTPQPDTLLPDGATLHLLFVTNTGVRALAADATDASGAAGDEVIVRVIERIEAVSVADRITDAAEKSVEGLTAFLKGLNDELGR